ncbi:hypothetical protein [Lutimonas sp.]|uniref:hypothetical protein n=1 Tax=Lutimonas sp. TaxID=1872403 RepID=UPI003D9BD4C9
MPLRQTIFPGLIVLLLFTACQKKEVQLPLIDLPGISEIQNHSSIWVFMKNDKGKKMADLNKNNKIINTHWIYNMDRRLPMKEVVPILINMQKNKYKDSMHKKGGMKSYFSYADTESESISLLLFPRTKFVSDSLQLIKEVERRSCSVVLELLEDEFLIKGRSYPLVEMPEIIAKEVPCEQGEQLKVLLKYQDDTQYQTYLEAKVYLNAYDIRCDSIEYFDTVK